MPLINFKGKTAIESYHLVVPHHTIEFDQELSMTESPSLDGNLIIEGDNLLALKSLLPTHSGKVKLIYIDPPYNTGNEGWIYNDNLTQPQFKEWIGQVVGKEGEDACRHDKWCCMMYPRLQLLKEFLRDDGIILVSIDDNEVHHLRMMMDEIYGAENYITELVWEKTRKNDAKLFSVGHEYMLIYAASLAKLKEHKTVWREVKPGAVEIMEKYRELRTKRRTDNKAIEKDLREWYKELPKTHPSKALSRYKHVDDNGPWRDRDISWPGGGGPRYDVLHHKTKLACKVPDAGWRFSTPEAMQRQIDLGFVEFRADHTDPPFRKAHLVPVPEELDDEAMDIEPVEDNEEEEAVGLQVMPSVIYKQSQVAVKHLRNLMGGKIFNNPKDHEVIGRLIRYCTGPGDLILDSFAGSGTTAHSVLMLNKEDGGERRYILVQMPQETKAQIDNGLNICQSVTRERVRRVICGYSYKTPQGNDVAVEGTGGEFTYVRVGSVLFDQFHNFKEGLYPSYEELARYIYYTETSQPLNVNLIDQVTGKIGEHAGKSYYLLYTPNGDEDKPVTKEWLESVSEIDRKPKVVYCEKIWVHRDELATFGNVRAMLVPFNLK